MSPTLRKTVPQPEWSFTIRKDIGNEMLNNWHYHPDYELLFIKRSAGTWLIGDYSGPFKSGDIILIGPNLPHSFRHEHNYIMDSNDDEPGESIVILFLKEMLGREFLNMPEIKGILHILKLSEKGLKLTGRTRKLASGIMRRIIDESRTRRLIALIDLLQLIAEKNEFQMLASSGFNYHSNGIDTGRIDTIIEYTFKNYQNRIQIGDLAALINMNKYTFCRYFKEKTRKSYVQFLTEVRIGKACRLLIERDMNISEVCYSCGYNNLSHFNHQFKSIKNKSPHEYIKDHIKISSSLYL